MTKATRKSAKKAPATKAAARTAPTQGAGAKAAPAPIEVSLAELVLLNNALNQALELGDSDYSTLIGGSKRAGVRLLARLGAALGAGHQ